MRAGGWYAAPMLADDESLDYAAKLDAYLALADEHFETAKYHEWCAEHLPDFDARVRIYTLRSAPMTELRGWLANTERGWAEQLTAFAAHLEREP